jgi:hypothetical protein
MFGCDALIFIVPLLAGATGGPGIGHYGDLTSDQLCRDRGPFDDAG